MNIALLLQMAAEACPDRTAITFEGEHYDYQTLFDAASRAAQTFSESGCRFVSALDTSSPAAPIALMGAAMAGLPYVPLNYRLTDDQLSALIERIEPAFLITGAGDCQFDVQTHMSREAFLRAAMADGPSIETWHEDPSAVAVQLFTSGTTGTPKAALLRHEHLVSYILGSVEFMGAMPEEATLVSVPPYHIAGISAVMSSIYACRRQVQLANFDAETWVRLCKDEAVTNAFVVPTMLTRIIDVLDEQDDAQAAFPQLAAIAYGGGKMPVPVIERALKLLPDVNFTNAYGLTETSSTITLLDPNDHREAISDTHLRQRLGSVGKALPSIELEIRDEDGQAVSAGTPGEIYVRGPQVSGEYDGRSVLDSEGWFPTRDAGYLDEGGYLFLSGRADDVIVRGGENISPGEIEDLLLDRDDVVDAAAVGMASEEWGEAVALALVMKTPVTEAAIQDFIRSSLRSSRVPEAIRFVDELPYNETGKLLRRVVREWF